MIYISAGLIHFHDVYGKTHREDGPAYILRNYKSWFKNGKSHRLDGPAYICGDYTYYYIEGIEYTETEYLAKQEQYYDKIKEKSI